MRELWTKIIVILSWAVLAISTSPAIAQVMQSTTYKIQSDSINPGGQSSSSTNYGLNDTLGEVGTGTSGSSTYTVNAGFWQMQDSFIAISSPSDLALSSIGGVTGGGSEGTIQWTVTTDNVAGYSMSINASTVPALQSAQDSFADYVPSGTDPDYSFAIAATDSEFGFSPEGVDVASRFKDNGSACNTGSSETSGKCWDGLSTTPKVITTRTTGNHPSGTSTTVRFRAEVGTSRIQTGGNYSATLTVTAVTL